MNEHIFNLVYESPMVRDQIHRHTLAVLVDNEYGVLSRVIGLFSGRGYNIESLTVAEVEHDKKRSRITIVTSGTERVIEQIKRLLEKMVPVYKVHDLTVEGRLIERELALIKVSSDGTERNEVLKIADVFCARVADATSQSFVFELTGESKKIDEFVDLMRPYGIIEICRTGIAAVNRGNEGI
jgi:acetolactate synthase-1/3 small subunit